VGSGSSRVSTMLPGVVAVDVLVPKLRYLKRKGVAVAQGNIFDLPFADRSFSAVVCSQVVEHIPAGARPFEELARVVAPGGLGVRELVLQHVLTRRFIGQHDEMTAAGSAAVVALVLRLVWTIAELLVVLTLWTRKGSQGSHAGPVSV
jgi:ubiquinone/menaquinone biosynthesis C-methylase UbiE